MDKFGIFKLLNSFLSPSSPSPTDNSNEQNQNISPPTDFLSGILNSLKSTPQNKEEAHSSTNPTPVLQQKTALRPLQNQMLSTMHSHDEIIKRINTASQKNNPF